MRQSSRPQGPGAGCEAAQREQARLARQTWPASMPASMPVSHPKAWRGARGASTPPVFDVHPDHTCCFLIAMAPGVFGLYSLHAFHVCPTSSLPTFLSFPLPPNTFYLTQLLDPSLYFFFQIHAQSLRCKIPPARCGTGQLWQARATVVKLQGRRRVEYINRIHQTNTHGIVQGGGE